MYKAMNNIREQKGFTLIELLIVVAIIGILAAVAIPGYIGMQERGRKGAVTRVASANEPELQAWMNSVKKAGTLQGSLIEIDTNGDGTVTTGSDLTNNALSAVAPHGMITQWITAHPTLSNTSPWAPGTNLWNDGGVVGTADLCEAAALNGRITLCYTPAGDSTITSVFVITKDKGSGAGLTDGATLTKKTLSSD